MTGAGRRGPPRGRARAPGGTGGREIRFLQASSAEIFGRRSRHPRTSRRRSPRSPYGAAKAYAHHLVGVYRGRGLHASTVILYNHESPRRPDDLRDPQDHRRRGRGRPGPPGAALPGQPRRPTRLGLGARLRRRDAPGRVATTRRTTTSSRPGSRTPCATSSRPPSPVPASPTGPTASTSTRPSSVPRTRPPGRRRATRPRGAGLVADDPLRRHRRRDGRSRPRARGPLTRARRGDRRATTRPRPGGHPAVPRRRSRRALSRSIRWAFPWRAT